MQYATREIGGDIMKKTKFCFLVSVQFQLFLIFVLGVLLVGCRVSSEPALREGDPEIGKELFHHTQEIAGAPTCRTCHVIEPGEPAIVGPNLSGIALRASQRVEGQTAEEYIRTSIVEPYAYVLPGYQSNIMVRNYGENLSQQQIADIVAYLMTLK